MFWGANNFRNGLRDYNLFQNKHIPYVYKTGTINVRRELLAGIIDTDGYYIDGCYEFVNKSYRLAKDVAFIARSLGLAAYLKTVQKKCCNTGAVGTYYKVQISGCTSQIPCRIERKRARPRKQIKDVLMTGKLEVGQLLKY